MPTPRMVQAAYQWTSEAAVDSASSPTQVISAPAMRIGRPPRRSINRPIRGAQKAETSIDHEKPPSRTVRETPNVALASPIIVAGM